MLWCLDRSQLASPATGGKSGHSHYLLAFGNKSLGEMDIPEKMELCPSGPCGSE